MSVRPLSPELAEIAQRELNEDPKRLKDDLQHLKDWIARQPHLRARTDDQWLVAFLRGCKFSLELTKEKLDCYYSCRTNAPDFFRIKHTDPRFLEILDLQTFLILPKVTGANCLVSIVRIGHFNPDKYNIAEVMNASIFVQKILLMECDNAMIAGMKSIIDLKGVTMAHYLQMTPQVIKKLIVFSQGAMPYREKGAHYLNIPSGFQTVFNAVKGLLSEKSQTRLYVHNKNYEELYKHIPKDVLPAEYGGNGGTFQEIMNYWKRKVEEYSSWLEEDEKYGTDESRRPGKPKTAEDMFGVEGSFRKLDID